MTDEAALGISLNIDVGRGKNFVLQTHVPRDGQNGMWNDTLDRMMEAAQRQVARCSLPDLKAQWELRKLRLSQMETDFIGLNMREESLAAEWNKDNRRRGPWKRPHQEQTHRDEMVVNIARVKQEITEYERLYKEAEEAAK